MSDDTGANLEFRPSKSERKRQSQDLQALGEALIELPESDLKALDLPEKLHDAVLLARRITAHGGLYRQKQYIGKLMRSIDAAPIRAALDARQARQRATALQFKRLESWRARLLEEGDTAVEAFVADYPAVDGEAVQRLIREARAEREQGRPPKAFRELLRFLRTVQENALLE